jgi:hypothetical protein
MYPQSYPFSTLRCVHHLRRIYGSMVLYPEVLYPPPTGWDCGQVNYTLAQQLYNKTGYRNVVFIDNACFDYVESGLQPFIDEIVESPLFGAIVFLEHNPVDTPPGFYYKRGFYFTAWQNASYPVAWMTESDGLLWIQYSQEMSSQPALIELQCNQSPWAITFQSMWVQFLIDSFGFLNICAVLYGLQVYNLFCSLCRVSLVYYT